MEARKGDNVFPGIEHGRMTRETEDMSPSDRVEGDGAWDLLCALSPGPRLVFSRQATMPNGAIPPKSVLYKRHTPYPLPLYPDRRPLVLGVESAFDRRDGGDVGGCA